MPQLLLGSSRNTDLVLVQPMLKGDPTHKTYEFKARKPLLYSTPAEAVLGKGYINALPTELLHKCFELCMGDSSSGRNLPTAHAISLTCKRFWHIVRPWLYSNIRLIPFWTAQGLQEPTESVLTQFLRTINFAPYLRECVKCLAISTKHFARIGTMPDTGQPDFVWLRKLELVVLDTWSEQEWNLCCFNIRGLQYLSELSIDLGNRYRHGGFQPFLGVVRQLPRLTKLSLHGVRDDREQSVSGDSMEFGSMSLVKDRNNLRAERPAPCASDLSCFSELHLSSFDHGNPAMLQRFLTSTASLEVFALDAIGMCGYSMEDLIEWGCMSHRWTFEHLRRSLFQHRSTLREMRIGQLGPMQEGLDQFDMYPFKVLRTLQICTLCLPEPERACDLWLTANLQRLVLESSFNDSQCGIIWHFGNQDVAWIANFSKIAADRRRTRAVGLRTIEVKYESESRHESLLSSAKATVEEHGFEFFWQNNHAE